ncbi:OmpH family outer membrane protein (plasmid) [Hymenobacter sp. BRD128]|uniref:OmpH family outer membrane protein n=1 Tax=Hymenobacter sp. BRD128 TaxID=2675878 RepID=UPI0015635461|nr:OmpH family outer membrane protein [Hymenobacter sp. BRD128]QKG59091.1 OmpH family outer membrane protein [Hymenobacter sp. BRD128]
MKNKYNKIACLSLLMLITIPGCKSVNVTYINPNKLLQGYHGAIAQRELFKIKSQDWQRRADSLNTELQNLNKALVTARVAKEQQLIHYRDAIQQQAQQENQRLTQAVLAEINAYLKQYGKEKGYTFILGATESGNIVYAAEGTDITEDVLKGLNAQYDRQHPTAAH